MSRTRTAPPPATRAPTPSPSLGGFLTDVWLPRKRGQVRATTAYRYAWIVDRYVLRRLGRVSLRSLRADHLDDLYDHLLSGGGKHGGPLAPKTVHEAHLVVRNALDLAMRCDLVDRNVALTVHSPRRRGSGTVVARVWNADEVAVFLRGASGQRLFPALHLAVHTGMRRGELVGLKWHDLDDRLARISVHRTIQCLAGTARRVRCEDAIKSAQHRSRPDHDVTAGRLASAAGARRASSRAR